MVQLSFRHRLEAAVKSRVASARTREALVQVQYSYELARNAAARVIPGLLTASPKFLTIAITARCNLRCEGCRYGRDYMLGQELPTETVSEAIRDAAAAGMTSVRLYGGEPLLHNGLPSMIREAISAKMTPFVSTNGLLLRRKMDSIFEAGLRIVTFGYYGHGQTYDSYVGMIGAWDRFKEGVAAARASYGSELKLHMSYVLNTRTCSVTELQKAWEFAKRFTITFHVDLVHYSLPYFTEGPNRELQFFASDRERLAPVVAELLRMKKESPELYPEPANSIRSISDWLLKGPDMRVPCDAYNMIWIGADGSVRLCFVTFPLGNLHQTPLRDLLFTSNHQEACARAIALDCPNCHCSRDTRIAKHLPSLIRYSAAIRRA